MEISIKDQLSCLAFSFVFGIAASFLYGLFRMFAKFFDVSCEHRKMKVCSVYTAVIQFVFDFTFCVFVSVGFQILLYVFDFGRFRLIYLLSSSLGFILYSKTLGKIVSRISDLTVVYIKKAITVILSYLLLPLKVIVRFLTYKGHILLRLLIIKPYRKFFRRKYMKKVRFIMENKLSDLVKFYF